MEQTSFDSNFSINFVRVEIKKVLVCVGWMIDGLVVPIERNHRIGASQGPDPT